MTEKDVRIFRRYCESADWIILPVADFGGAGRNLARFDKTRLGFFPASGVLVFFDDIAVRQRFFRRCWLRRSLLNLRFLMFEIARFYFACRRFVFKIERIAQNTRKNSVRFFGGTFG